MWRIWLVRGLVALALPACDAQVESAVAADTAPSDSATVDTAFDTSTTADADASEGGTCTFTADSGVVDFVGATSGTTCVLVNGLSAKSILCPTGSVCVLAHVPSSPPFYGFAPGCVRPEDAVGCTVTACGATACASPGTCGSASGDCHFGSA